MHPGHVWQTTDARARGPFALPAVFLLAAAGGSLLGCGGPRGDEPTFVVSDSAGVRIVVSERPFWAPGAEWTVSATPILEIGAVQGDAPLQLHDLLGVTRLSDGRVVVLDGGSSELRFFGPSGEHLGALGGPGDGPGELNRPSGLLRLAGDTLGVTQQANWVVGWFTPDGGFVRTERLDVARHTEAVGTMFGCPERPALLADASFLACVGEGASRHQSEAAPRPSHLLVRSPYDVSWADTIGTVHGFTLQLGFAARGTQVTAGGDPLRIFVGDPAFFEIEVIDDRSGRIASIRYPDGLKPVRPQDIAEYEDYLERWRASRPPGAVTQTPAEFAYPSFMPGFTSLHYDAAGFLWAVAYRPPWQDEQSALVFSEDGPLLGRVDLPAGFQIREIGADFLLGVWRDALGVEFVRMYGLNRGSAGDPA